MQIVLIFTTIKRLTIAICLLMVFLTGCGGMPAESVIDEPQEEATPVSEPLKVEEKFVPEYNIVCTSKYEKERFLNISGESLYFHDGWVFYANRDEVRRCRPDFTEDALVIAPPMGMSANLALNHDGFSAVSIVTGPRRGSKSEVQILDVHNGRIEKLDSVIYGGFGRLLYKDVFIVDQNEVIEGKGSTVRLDMYDRKGAFVKTIASDIYPNDVAVLNDAVYYLPGYGDEDRTLPPNTIMRYDLTTGETEKFFEFDLAETSWGYDWSKIYFHGRTVIIRKGLNAAMYFDIDEMEPIEIDFGDIEMTEDDYISFIPSTGDDIFLAVHYPDPALYYENVEPRDITKPYDFFKVVHGTSKPVLLQTELEYQGRTMMFSDGYVYYVDEHLNLKREEWQ